MFIFNKFVESEQPGEGISRKILARGGEMMTTEAVFKKGAVGDLHRHPHEQVCYIVSGSFEYDVDGDKRVLKKGDSVYVAPNVLHGTVALEEGSVILDVFTPQREDYLK